VKIGITDRACPVTITNARISFIIYRGSTFQIWHESD